MKTAAPKQHEARRIGNELFIRSKYEGTWSWEGTYTAAGVLVHRSHYTACTDPGLLETLDKGVGVAVVPCPANW